MGIPVKLLTGNHYNMYIIVDVLLGIIDILVKYTFQLTSPIL